MENVICTCGMCAGDFDRKLILLASLLCDFTDDKLARNAEPFVNPNNPGKREACVLIPLFSSDGVEGVGLLPMRIAAIIGEDSIWLVYKENNTKFTRWRPRTPELEASILNVWNGSAVN